MYKIIIAIVLVCICSICNAEQFLCEIDIAGKIIDQDGNLVTGDVTLTAELESWTYPDLWKPGAKTFEEQIKTEYTTIDKIINGGVFSWKLPDTDKCRIIAKKEGYYEDYIDLHDEDNKIIVKDLIVHLVKKGTPSKLEHVETFVPSNILPQDKPYGWSFSKLWYFPIDEDDTVWLTQTYNDEGKIIYTMKEQGGFVYYKGYPRRESEPDYYYTEYEWMPEAPESGYSSTISWDDYREQQNYGNVYCYFKTPDGKYGKMRINEDSFDYYLQPNGSRDLEAGEVEKLGPVYPGYQEWLNEWAR